MSRYNALIETSVEEQGSMPQSASPEQPYVFVSYASADRERVLDVVATLRGAGIECWLDHHDIAAGANWGGSIAEAIAGCTVLVLVSSAASLSSRNVRQEVALAWQYDKPTIPLLLDPTPVPTDMAYWLATAQWVDVLDQPVEAWLPKVQQALSRLDEGSDAPVDAATADSPRPKSRTHLPSPASSFVGRERDVAEIAALLHTERVVTLTGPGGIGKTRVAIAVGHRLADQYADGVVFVDLAPLHDPMLVLPTIAAAVEVRESGEAPLFDALVTALQQRRLLLILDNLEQVIAAAPDISRLVTALPSLAMLATSREALRIAGEAEYPITPLPLPQRERAIDVEQLRANATVALFVQRARSSRPDFDLTPENAEAIIAICQRLDGLPLAVELAAARVRLLTPWALAERLSDPLRVLTAGARDLPDRQRTIRDTVQWSYDLLTPEEQRLFRRLSVFVGGWTLESAEAVVNADGELGLDLLDGLTSLVEKNLVVEREHAQDDTPRFTMLVMIHEFAEQQLSAAGEQRNLFARHAAAMATFAEQADAAIRGHQQRQTIRRLNAEQANLRAVMQRSLRDGEIDADVGRRTAVALTWFWSMLSRMQEGRDWLSLALAATAGSNDALHARARIGDGMLRWLSGEVESAIEPIMEGTRAIRALGDTWYAAFGLHQLAHLYVSSGDLNAAVREFEQSIADFEAVHDAWGVALGHSCLGHTLFGRGDYDAARTLMLQAAAEMEQVGDDWYLSATWQALADLTFAQRRFDESAAWNRASLLRFNELGDDVGVADTIVRLGQIAVAIDQPERAAQLFGAAAVIHDAHHLSRSFRFPAAYDETVATLRVILGDAAMQQQWLIGRELSRDGAIALATSGDYPELDHARASGEGSAASRPISP